MPSGRTTARIEEAFRRLEAELASRKTTMQMLVDEAASKEPLLTTRTKVTPKNAYLKDGLRYYPWQGQQLMSVTSLRQQVGTPIGLVKWMQRQVAERALNSFLDLTRDITDPSVQEEDIIKWLVSGATEKRDAAGSRGSAIHQHVATIGDPTLADPEIRPYVENYQTAIHNLFIEPLLVEKQVFAPSMGYAGSFDLIGRKGGEVTLIDLKTGGSLYIDNALQLAGYVLADFVGADDVIDEEATRLLHSVTHLGLLHVTDVGYDYVDVPLTQELGDAFRAQLTLALFYAKHPNLIDLTGKEPTT
jgi:hypothetical protein